MREMDPRSELMKNIRENKIALKPTTVNSAQDRPPSVKKDNGGGGGLMGALEGALDKIRIDVASDSEAETESDEDEWD